MEQPPGFSDPDHPDYVCLLQHSLYGLKQAPRCWHKYLTSIFEQLGLHPSPEDPGLFLSSSSSLFILAHVDDLAIIGDAAAVRLFKERLASVLEIKDMGPISFFLGIQVTRDRSTRRLSLNQSHYIDAKLEEFNLTDAHPVSLPMDPGAPHLLGNVVSSPTPPSFPYRALTGSLLYLSITTRPDIAFAVSYLSSFNNCYNDAHVQAAKRVLRYLKGTKHLHITFGAQHYSDTNISGYADSNLGGTLHDRRSVMGHIFFFGGGPIYWKSARQSVIATSSAEAEYRALTPAVQFSLWLQRLLLSLNFSPPRPFPIYEDNLPTKKFAENMEHLSRMRHIDLHQEAARDHVKKGDIKLITCPSTDNLADILTKATSLGKLSSLRDNIGLCR